MRERIEEEANLHPTSSQRSIGSVDDWFDPTDSGRMHVQYVEGAGTSLRQSFTKIRKNSWFEDDFPEDHIIYVGRYERRRKYLITVCLSLVAFFAAVTVSVLLAKSRVAHNNPAIEDAKRTASFHPITESLVSACSLKAIQSISGKKLCEEMCSVADCCMIPDGEEFSCYAERTKDCNDYHRVCSVVDLPDDQLTDLHDLHLSEKVISTCKSENLLHLEGEKECANLCHDHQCCFEKDTTKNCVKDPSKKCHVYSGCFTMFDEIEETIFENTFRNCNNDVLTTVEQFNKCHSLCAPHLCCFSSDPNENCAKDKSNLCISYSPCAALTNSSMNVEPNIDGKNWYDDSYEYIAEKCDKDKLHDEEALQACHKTCSKAMCCFSHKDMKSNCKDSLGEDICNTYRPCEILANGDADPNIVVNGPDLGDIPDLCSADRMKNENSKNLCKQTCLIGECCFRHGGCYQQDTEWCQSFEECKNLGNRWATFGTEHMPNKESKAAEIAEICALDNFAETFGQDSARSVCHRLCDPYQCCFHETGQLCDQEACDDFSGCSELYVMEHHYARVESSCSPSGNIAKCQEICQGKLCCFDDPIDPSTCHVDSCAIYGACAKLLLPHH